MSAINTLPRKFAAEARERLAQIAAENEAADHSVAINPTYWPHGTEVATPQRGAAQ